MEPEFKRGKEVVISLAMAVAKENNRGSIASLQQAGRPVELAVEVEVLNEGAAETLDGEVAEALISTDSRPKKRQRQRRVKFGGISGRKLFQQLFNTNQFDENTYKRIL